METAIYQQALEAATQHRDLLITPMTAGLINKTYKVTIEHSGEKFLLQQINTEVFPEPGELQDNYYRIWTHLQQETGNSGYPVQIPAPLNFQNGSNTWQDHHKKFWRIFEFMENTQTLQVPANAFQARMVAHVFGAVTSSFESFDIASLHTTLHGFHDLSLRFEQFREALHSKDYERLQKAAPLIAELKKRERYVSFYEVITSSAAFKQRLMHHDAKIANVLFDEDTGEPVCPVDFDTCMPGYYFSDLGDMIRSMAASEDENSTNFDQLLIRQEYYTAILESYLDTLSSQLTDAERKYIHYAGLLVIYMQALRYITDYLQGDSYYRTDHTDQNLNRAKNQLTLLERLEEFLAQHYNFLHD
jgi:Ser/Thr protein kinase RdoA (MazF antagonist)